jgi:hypothetical protein
VINGMTKHFMFHIRWISILNFLYFNFFLDSFRTTFLSDGIATSVSKQILSFLFLIIMSGLFARTSLSVCIPWFHSTVISSYIKHTSASQCVSNIIIFSNSDCIPSPVWRNFIRCQDTRLSFTHAVESRLSDIPFYPTCRVGTLYFINSHSEGLNCIETALAYFEQQSEATATDV